MATQVNQTPEPPTFIGWKVSDPIYMPILNKISSIIACALLLIAGLFSSESAKLRKAFNADMAQLNKETDQRPMYRNGTPDHKTYEKMRQALLLLVGKGKNTDTYVQCLGWKGLHPTNFRSDFERLAAAGQITGNIDTWVKNTEQASSAGHLQTVHTAFLDLRAAIRAYGTDPVRQLLSCFREDEELEYALSKFRREIAAIEMIFAKKKDLTGFDVFTHLRASLEKLEAASISWGVSSSEAPSPRSAVRAPA
jgi:hypothetical protein